MRKRKTTPPWKYIIPAILFHVAILLLPGTIYETFFPSSGPRQGGPPSDLTPDFEKFSIHIVYIENEEPRIEVREESIEPADDEVNVMAVTEDGAGSQPAGPVPQEGVSVSGGHSSDMDTLPGHGGEDGLIVVEEPRFYPPVPSLIVPPSVEGLDVADLTIRLRIRVNKHGRPVEVVILDAVDDEAVVECIMEAARSFRFRPARRGSEPVESTIEIPLSLETTRRN